MVLNWTVLKFLFLHLKPIIIFDPIPKWPFIEKSIANMTAIEPKLVNSTKMTLYLNMTDREHILLDK